MKIHFPRVKAGEEGKVVDGLLRNIEKVGDKWEVKITVPALSTIQNLYLEFTDSEIQEFCSALKGSGECQHT